MRRTHNKANTRRTAHRYELRLPAIEYRQGKTHRLYTFAVDGKMLPSFAAISRLSRQEDGHLVGYQRPEVISHIAEIRTYLESPNPMVPNALVIAFNETVEFKPAPGYFGHSSISRPGTLIIPVVPGADDANKPGWIVDGQQRCAAIRDARVSSFPVCVTAFITSNVQEQQSQFILVNSTKPLPKGLIYELLPTTSARLPTILQRRQFPTHLLQRLNQDGDSPLNGRIRTPTNPEGVIQDNSVLKMLENSLTDGALYVFRNPDSGDGDANSMLTLLKHFWTATAKVFPEAWKLPPTKSRLTHGAGIVSLGFVMDAISDRYRSQGIPTQSTFADDIEPLREVCRWTNGYWDFGPNIQRKWNEIQNTPKDIQLLSNYLLGKYRALVWNKAIRTSA